MIEPLQHLFQSLKGVLGTVTNNMIPVLTAPFFMYRAVAKLLSLVCVCVCVNLKDSNDTYCRGLL